MRQFSVLFPDKIIFNGDIILSSLSGVGALAPGDGVGMFTWGQPGVWDVGRLGRGVGNIGRVGRGVWGVGGLGRGVGDVGGVGRGVGDVGGVGRGVGDVGGAGRGVGDVGGVGRGIGDVGGVGRGVCYQHTTPAEQSRETIISFQYFHITPYY